MFILALIRALRRLMWKTILRLRRGGSIGPGCFIGSSVVLASSPGHPITLGPRCKLMQGAVLSTAKDGRIDLAEDVYIGEYCSLTSNASISIGAGTLVAPMCTIVDFNHVRDPDTGLCLEDATARPIVIGRGVWIGSGARILAGVTLGDGAIVGAQAVVNRDVPAGATVVGVPAREVGR